MSTHRQGQSKKASEAEKIGDEEKITSADPKDRVSKAETASKSRPRRARNIDPRSTGSDVQPTVRKDQILDSSSKIDTHNCQSPQSDTKITLTKEYESPTGGGSTNRSAANTESTIHGVRYGGIPAYQVDVSSTASEQSPLASSTSAPLPSIIATPPSPLRRQLNEPQATTWRLQGPTVGNTNRSADTESTTSSEDFCPICRTVITQRSALDICAHLFCFPCITEWAKISTNCPVCRADFTAIYHNIAENGEYDIRPVQYRRLNDFDTAENRLDNALFRINVIDIANSGRGNIPNININNSRGNIHDLPYSLLTQPPVGGYRLTRHVVTHSRIPPLPISVAYFPMLRELSRADNGSNDPTRIQSELFTRNFDETTPRPDSPMSASPTLRPLNASPFEVNIGQRNYDPTRIHPFQRFNMGTSSMRPWLPFITRDILPSIERPQLVYIRPESTLDEIGSQRSTNRRGRPKIIQIPITQTQPETHVHPQSTANDGRGRGHHTTTTARPIRVRRGNSNPQNSRQSGQDDRNADSE